MDEEHDIVEPMRARQLDLVLQHRLARDGRHRFRQASQRSLEACPFSAGEYRDLLHALISAVNSSSVRTTA